MQPFTADAVYVNYLGETRDEGQARIRAAYGTATYDRLAALKRRVRSDQLLPHESEHRAGLASDETERDAGRSRFPPGVPLGPRAAGRSPTPGRYSLLSVA